MSEQIKRILFKQIVVNGQYYDRYSTTCPSCDKKIEVSGDVKNEAERDGIMTMTCCDSVEKIYDS